MKQSIGADAFAYPAPVLVIGSYDEAGRPNIMTVISGGLVGMHPPLFGISLGPSSFTHDCILKTRAFTVNVPSAAQARAADYVGLCSGRDTDKFAAAGLTPVRSELVNAPYIKEFPLVMECRLLQTIELGQHTQFIGQILDIKADPAALDDNGKFDLARCQPLMFMAGPQAAYHNVGEPAGFAFTIGRELLK